MNSLTSDIINFQYKRMKVFKFGGASVNSAQGVRNLLKIIQNYRDEMVIVVSAMGKTTNALELIVAGFFNKNASINEIVDELRSFHFSIINDLFSNKEAKVYNELETLFLELEAYLKKKPSLNFNFEYDQIVSFGELFSTKIISEYLKIGGTINKWIDIRSVIITDDTYREAQIDWDLSAKLVIDKFNSSFVYVTQGFIGGTRTNATTTLGREGSDYTAAVLSYFLDADEMVIWKDVPGIMSADPKWMDDVVKLDRISYQEAVELAFYGAKVIHPRTIQPIQNKKIPLHVRSFINPLEVGTIISSKGDKQSELTPIFIQKENQVLLSISPCDFSFIMEENLSEIFSILAKYSVKVNLIQNSAISFSVCMDMLEFNFDLLIKEMQNKFEVKYNDDLELITIRHQDEKSIKLMTDSVVVYLEQRSRDTAQFVVRR